MRQTGTNRQPVCDFLLLVNSNVGHIFFCFRDIVKKTSETAIFTHRSLI